MFTVLSEHIRKSTVILNVNTKGKKALKQSQIINLIRITSIRIKNGKQK
jgi:hypothetical protein